MTQQADFAAAILAGCQQRGIHTAVETCGWCSWPQLERLASHADLILYDLKLWDEAQHRHWTGATNRQILANARHLASLPCEVVVRVPLIPEITDTADNLHAIFCFARDSRLNQVELLPYNPSAGAKYEWLGLSYDIKGEPQDDQRLAELSAMARELGLGVVGNTLDIRAWR